MALYVELTNVDNSPNKIFEYHIGENWPKNVNIILEYVVSLQADGDELQHIISIWHNSSLPIPSKRVVKWFGDNAKMILANW